MERSALLKIVERRLGKRRLIWVGLRGEDAEPLADIEQFAASFSLMSRYVRRSGIESESYERISGVRVDPEVWDMDAHLAEEPVAEFRRALLRALTREGVVLPYRPSAVLSAISFAQRDRMQYLGLFASMQSAFEHKPWVESSIAALPDVPHVPWVYIADEDQLEACSLFDGGTVILRRSRTSGGEGIVHAHSPEDIRRLWPHGSEAFASVSRFIERGTPVNVGATVWRDGVTVHHPSVQLIGIPGLVGREFGFCGNDFGRARELEPATILEIERSTKRIGEWLARNGYLGSFGVDFLVHDGHALFLEVNPRFQGSTHASSRLDIESGTPDLMLEHMAAWLGVDCPPSPSLRERVASTPDLSHVVFHWLGEDGASVDVDPLVARIRDLPGRHHVELAPPTEVRCATGAAILRWSTWQSVTRSGYELLEPFTDLGATSMTQRKGT